jgi:phage baseplate assembly protein W
MAIINRDPNYSDLDLDFLAHPTTGDIVKKKGEDAVKRSIRNLVLTNYYEKPFRSYVGSNAYKMLFENPNYLTANAIKDDIKNTISRLEPRVVILAIDVTYNEEGDGYVITIGYSLVNRPEPLVTTIFLERIR